MKKRMIFPLMLLFAPAALQSMEVANSWQLPKETRDRLYAEFMKPSWPVKKDPFAGLSGAQLAEKTIAGLMLQANGCGADDAKFAQRLRTLIGKIPADKLAALTTNVVTDPQQESGTTWQEINKTAFTSYPANMTCNTTEITRLEAESKTAQATAQAQQAALDAAQKAFENKKQKEGYNPRAALAAAEQKSIATAEKPAAQGVVARLRAQADKIEAFEETFKRAVALRAITSITTSEEIEALSQKAAEAKRSATALQAQIDERHDANALLVMLKHGKVAQLETILAELKARHTTLKASAGKNDASIADLLAKEQDGKKFSTKEAQRLNQLRADNGRLSEEMQKLSTDITALDTALHPKADAPATGLLGWNTGWGL